MALVEAPLTIASTVTSAGALVAGAVNRVDPSAGNLTMTLPTPSAPARSRLTVMHVGTANNVVISGSLQGSSTTYTITGRGSSVTLMWSGSTWWPLADYLPESVAVINTKWTAKGDILAATAAGTPSALPVGTDGQVLTADSASSRGVKWGSAAGASVTRKSPPVRTGAITETIPRSAAAAQTIVSGQLQLHAVDLRVGDVVSTISFMSVAAAVTPTNWWFALYSPALALLGTTADQTTTAWGATAEKTLSLSSAYTVPSDGIYYLGVMVAAATPPTLIGVTGNAALVNTAPALALRDTTHAGLTNPASAPATFTAGANINSLLYGWCA